MTFPISHRGDLPVTTTPDGPDILEALESDLAAARIGGLTRDAEAVVFQAGWTTAWPFVGCAGAIELDEQGQRLIYRLSFRAWALAMAVIIPLIFVLLLDFDVGLAPVIQFGILFAGLPFGWLGAMTVVHFLLGTQIYLRWSRIIENAVQVKEYT